MNTASEEWLQKRRTGIGGSDAAIACGLHPYVAPIELYLDKIGEAPFERKTPNACRWAGSLRIRSRAFSRSALA